MGGTGGEPLKFIYISLVYMFMCNVHEHASYILWHFSRKRLDFFPPSCYYESRRLFQPLEKSFEKKTPDGFRLGLQMRQRMVYKQ